MKKIGLTTTGNILVEMTPAEYLNFLEKMQLMRSLSEWPQTEAYAVARRLYQGHPVSKLETNDLAYAYQLKEYDGSLAQLKQIVAGKRRSRSISGKLRARIRPILAEMEQEGSSNASQLE